jgi:hypothetical protein
VIKQDPSRESGPARNHCDIHQSKAAPTSVLTVPGEVVNGIGGHRLGCIPLADTWIGQCHRKSPPPRPSIRMHKEPRCGPSSELSSWVLPPDLQLQPEFHYEGERKSLLAPPIRLTPQYGQGSAGYKSSSCALARWRSRLELRLADQFIETYTGATDTNRTAAPSASTAGGTTAF